MIFRNGLVAFSAPPGQSDAGGCWGRVRALPRAAHLGLLFFLGGQLRVFDLPPIAPVMVLPWLAIFFTARARTHRPRTNAQAPRGQSRTEPLTTEFFGCQLPHDRGEREFSSANHSGGSTPLMGVKTGSLCSGLACRGFRPAPCAPLAWATPGTPRRSSHMRHSWLNFFFAGIKKRWGGQSGRRQVTEFDPPLPSDS